MKGLFLFGAGASFDCVDVIPANPPLGKGLYQAICKSYPKSWGVIKSYDSNANSIFNNNFESGMEYLCQHYPDKVAEYWQDMARYFAGFRLGNSKKDCYSYILSQLIANKKIEDYALSTLNYECLLELAICNNGRTVTYWCSEGIKPGGTIVWKLHGSCNFKVRGIAVSKGVTFRINDVMFNGEGIECIQGLDSVNDYCNKSAIPPCMALYAPGKPNQVGRPYIEEIQRQWSEYLSNAAKVIIIGIAPNLEDGHIWKPLSKCKGHIYYVGGGREFKRWAKRNRKCCSYSFLGETFSESLIRLQEIF